MNAADLPAAVLWTHRLLGVGLLIQTAELLCTRHSFARGGVLEGSWATPWLLARLGLAGLLVLAPTLPTPWSALIVNGLLLGNSLWLTVRSRGPVCGGSDSMFFQVQLGLLLTSLGFWEPLLIRVGLGWIAVQSSLSYLLAGVAKLKNAGWRHGGALQNLMSSAGPYVVFAPARRLAERRAICASLGWAVVGFELLLPAALVLPLKARIVLLTLGVGFHLFNAVVLGLNRFVWAWVATYPAILVAGR